MTAMGEARAILRLFGAQLRLATLAALQYRVGFWSEGVLSVLWSALGVVPLLVAAQHRPAVAGWGPWELMVLTGVFMAISGIFGALVQPALVTSMEHVRKGTLDHLLLRPVDALALCLSSSFSPWRLVEVVTGAILCAVSLRALGVAPSLVDLGAAAVVMVAGVGALYGLAILALCATFRAVQLQNLTHLFEALLDFARWPASVFGGPLRAIFTFVVPFAVMTTFPAEALLGRPSAGALGVALGVAAALLGVARFAWRVSLRTYASASS